MEFSFSEEQRALRELAAKIFSTRANDETLRGFVGAGDWLDRELWRELAEASLLGLNLATECGGAGLGLLDLCILLEEQGRCLAPVPLLHSVVLGGWALSRCDRFADVVRAVVAGDEIVTVALEEEGGFDLAKPRTRARRSGDGWLLDGCKASVAHAGISASIVTSARSEDDELVLVAVDPAAPGVALERQTTVAYEPHFRMTLDGVRLPAARTLARASAAEQLLAELQRRGFVALAALQVGICEEALRRTAAYTTERQQFGRPIGSFQGVSLRAADAYMAVEAMRSTMWQAAWRIDNGLPAAVESRVAKWWAAKGGQEVVHTTQHLHGGIGSDVDYPIHRYFLWAKQIGMSLGGEARALQSLAGEVTEKAVAERG